MPENAASVNNLFVTAGPNQGDIRRRRGVAEVFELSEQALGSVNRVARNLEPFQRVLISTIYVLTELELSLTERAAVFRKGES